MKIDGCCHCGRISFEAIIDPDKIGICHCTDCQALSASAFRTIAITLEDGFKVLSGTPKVYVKIGDSGNRRAQAFCGDCGSAIHATSADDDGPKVYNIRLGVVRQRNRLAPKFQAWTRSAQPWLAAIDSIPKSERQ